MARAIALRKGRTKTAKPSGWTKRKKQREPESKKNIRIFFIQLIHKNLFIMNEMNLKSIVRYKCFVGFKCIHVA